MFQSTCSRRNATAMLYACVHAGKLAMHVPVSWAGSWRDPIMTEEVMAPLTGLANLQCLQLQLQSFHRNYWGWLQQLRRLTSIHISEYGKYAHLVRVLHECLLLQQQLGKDLLPHQ